MKLYKMLAINGCVTRSDIVSLTGSESAAAWHINQLLENGCIERVRRGLYAVISLETGWAISNRFQIASALAPDATITCHSAFEYYGYANQVCFEVYVASNERIRPFTYDGIRYKKVNYQGDYDIVTRADNVRVTSLERTVVDSIANIDRIAGLEEFLRCLMILPALRENHLLGSLEMYDSSMLYQKTGYVLENYQKDLYLSDSFFSECEKKIGQSRTYFSKERRDFAYNSRWHLYAPKDLNEITSKGVILDAIG